jgi:tRNA A-37 threonylcarbamoyl transferase component Bud32
MAQNERLKISVGTDAKAGPPRLYDGDQSILIGKDKTCDLVLDCRGVSRKHCCIAIKEDRWCIADLGSTNGTLVNGKAAPERSEIQLSDGDTIAVGEAVLHIGLEKVMSDQFTEILQPHNLVVRDLAVTEVLAPIAAQQNSNPMNRLETMIVQPEGGLSAKREKSDKEHRKPSAAKNNRQPDKPNAVTVSLPRDREIPIPEQIRNYRIGKRIGEGGMGEVFLAHDKSDKKKTYAIKLLKPQSEQTPQDQSRFLREMEIALKLQHASIIRCTDCGEESNRLFIVMDYCNGGNLAELLARNGKLNIRRSLRLVNRLLAGVDEAHKQGIVHRDLKPQNILLHREPGGKYLPKISDFGLAKSYLQAGESGITVNGSVGGSWAYMPKEQLTNFRFVQPQSDVWSLGAILYECLTLFLPRKFEKGADPIRTILESKIVPLESVLPDVPIELARFMSVALAQEPEGRFNDAGEMQAELGHLAKLIGVDL